MDAFYDQLKADLESTPHHEMKTVMGDLNEDDDKGRQAGLHERPGNSSRRGHQQGRTRTGVQYHQDREQSGDTDTPIVDKQGKLLTKEAEQEARWAQYFSEFLNRPQPRRLKQK